MANESALTAELGPIVVADKGEFGKTESHECSVRGWGGGVHPPTPLCAMCIDNALHCSLNQFPDETFN